MKIAVALLAAVAVSAVALCYCFLGVQPLSFRYNGQGVVIDLQRLGEYQANVERVRVTDIAEGKVVWEAECPTGTTGVWTIPLVAGENPVTAASDQLRVLVPVGKSSFQLEQDRLYRFEVTSVMELGRSNRSTTFAMLRGAKK